MAIVFAVLVLASGLLTLGCTLYWPRTIFGILLLIGVGFFIAISFGQESSKTAAFIVAVPFLLTYVGIVVHAAYRVAKKSDALLWRRAGMSGMYLRFLQYRVTGKEARNYWGMRAVCAGCLAVALAGGLTARLARPGESRPDTHAEEERVRIVDATQHYSSLNNAKDAWARWPSAEIQELAGEKAWGQWRPNNGDEAVILGTMDMPAGPRIYILKIEDQDKVPHYVPMDAPGVRVRPALTPNSTGRRQAGRESF